MDTSLLELKVGDTARILGFKSGCSVYQQKLLAMGLVPNTEFKVVRVAPLGDPVEIQVYNSSLCIRKQEGSVLQLKRLMDFVR